MERRVQIRDAPRGATSAGLHPLPPMPHPAATELFDDAVGHKSVRPRMDEEISHFARILRLLSDNCREQGVAVEKLAYSEFAKIGSRQEALQTIFPSLLDIFYHPIFDSFQKNRVFQQPQGFLNTYPKGISLSSFFQPQRLAPPARS